MTEPKVVTKQFDYLLNAFELASQSDKPAENGYAEKRAALFAYVRSLEGALHAIADHGWTYDGAVSFTINVATVADAKRLHDVLSSALSP
jgi:hypothetical protein